ncbi:peptide ABC transporter substrate-binding protein [Streptomyces violascens]|uniref:Peptide ABC transporter substrate-binding protein n=1 Tax=Streptomyces violascens TaxID=67381 RepID=A0ABQ3QZV4_9ACTN|nr:peptide ABC transporter substrate-binding protein [Streptomyces violascens]GHI42782.1 peptide ABC transporter substrate-binding protein [Streptomyces violascens]
MRDFTDSGPAHRTGRDTQGAHYGGSEIVTTQGSSRRKTAAGAAIVVAALLSTAACGGGGSSDNGGKAPGFNAANSKVANASAKKGGELKFVGTQDADSWDPQRGYYGFMWDYARYYTRTLITYKPGPGKESETLVPDIATGLADVSADKKTYTYHLKDGVKWEDGKPVTSKDVKYGIERIWAQDVISGGPVYLKDVLDPTGEYKGPYKDTSPDKLGLKAIETPDDKTIVFKLPAPNVDFQQMLAMPSGSPVRQDKDTQSKYGLKPFSLGPYKWESYSPNKSMVLVRNSNWDPKTDDVRKALPDKISLTLLTSADDMDNRLINGDYDVDINGTGLGAAGRTKALQQHKGNVDNPDTGYIRYAVFPQTVAPMDNEHCRKAVIYAADHKSLQTARGGPQAGGDIATNMLPPIISGSDPKYDPYGVTANDGAANIAKAKEELGLCGKPGGFSTTIAVRNNKQVEVATAQSMQAALAKVNIKADIDQYDGAQTTGIIGNPEVVKKKNYGIIIMGWGPDFASGQGFLLPLVDSKYILPNGNNNYSMLKDPAIDKLFDDAIAAGTPEEAAGIYKQINQKVSDHAVYLPFVFEKNVKWRSSRLTNVYTTTNNNGFYDYASLGVEK